MISRPKKKQLIVLLLVAIIASVGWIFPNYFESKLPIAERDEVQFGMRLSSMVFALLKKEKEITGHYPESINEISAILSPQTQQEIKDLKGEYHVNPDKTEFTFSFTTNKGGKVNCVWDSSSSTWFYNEIAD